MIFLDFEKPLEDLFSQINKLKELSAKNKVDAAGSIRELEAAIEKTRKQIYDNLTPWQRVQLSRHPDRPYTLYYIDKIFTNFTELFGDRQVKDDKAMVGGMAELNGQPVMVLGQQKGTNTKLRQLRNFGMANPEGYRKSTQADETCRKIQQACYYFHRYPRCLSRP
jgi:acetyl-CoA carboxylase carboxyl transferase subunit alpha